MKQRFFLVFLAMALFVLACNKDSDSSIPETRSGINIFNAVPGLVAEATVDTTSIGSAAGGESTGYHDFIAKRYDLTITTTGVTSIILTGQISLRNNHFYTVFISMDNTNNLRVQAVEDNMDAPEAGKGKVRVVNLSDTYNSVGEPLTFDFNFNISPADTMRLRRQSYQAVTGYLQIPAGSYTRDIFYADSSLNLNGNIPREFTVEDKKIYSWIIYGNSFKADSFKLVEFKHN